MEQEGGWQTPAVGLWLEGMGRLVFRRRSGRGVWDLRGSRTASDRRRS
jgi:hypothetical protein